MATWQGNYPSAMYDGLMEELLRDVPDGVLAPLRALDEAEPFTQRWRAAGARFGQNLRMSLMGIGADMAGSSDARQLLADYAAADSRVCLVGSALYAAGTIIKPRTGGGTVTQRYIHACASGTMLAIVGDTAHAERLVAWCEARGVPYILS